MIRKNEAEGGFYNPDGVIIERQQIQGPLLPQISISRVPGDASITCLGLNSWEIVFLLISSPKSCSWLANFIQRRPIGMTYTPESFGTTSLLRTTVTFQLVGWALIRLLRGRSHHPAQPLLADSLVACMCILPARVLDRNLILNFLYSGEYFLQDSHLDLPILSKSASMINESPLGSTVKFLDTVKREMLRTPRFLSDALLMVLQVFRLSTPMLLPCSTSS